MADKITRTSYLKAMFEAFNNLYPEAGNTYAGHSIFADYNLAPSHLRWGLNHLDAWFGDAAVDLGHSEDEGSAWFAEEEWKRHRVDDLIALKNAMKAFLELLLTFSEKELDSLEEALRS